MGSDWQTYTLGELTEWSSGGTPRKMETSFWGGDIPWISASSMEGHLYSESKNTLTKEGLESGSRLAPKNSILLLVRGSILHQKIQVGIATRDVAFNQDVKCLVAKEKLIDPWYLLLWFHAKEKELLAIVESTGIGAGKLDTKLLQAIPVRLPPIEERVRIRNFGKALLDKIILNRQINQTLEQMAQALFKSWFVDFDPVIDNALDAGNSIPDELQARAEQRQALRNASTQQGDTSATPAGTAKPLPDNIRQLFPNEFEESVLGWVPKGWTFKSVSEVIQVNPKVKLAKGDLAKFVDMKALPTSGYSIEDISTKAFSGGAKFAKNDVLLARITPCLQNGKTGFVDFLGNNEVGFGSTEFIVLRATDSVSPTYIACLARDEKFRKHAMQSMVGSSGRQRVQNSCFDDYYLAVPSLRVINKFNEMTGPAFDKFKINTNENVALEKLRDTLLPKLISGELRLDEVESTIEEALTA